MAIRINRVYTRSGDDGKTALVGGSRVAKSDLRISAYGDVDELNSVIGLVCGLLGEPPYRRRKAARELTATLLFVQQELFDLGGELATPASAVHKGMPRMGAAHVKRLEGFIDELQPDLQPLKSFVLPGGGSAGAALHIARTVCRRAERRVSELVAKKKTGPWTAKYLNRLSDLLFVQARWIAAKTGHAETLWQHGLQTPARKTNPTPKPRTPSKPARGKPTRGTAARRKTARS